MRHAPLATAVITACITSPVFAAENIEIRAEERSEERAQQRSAHPTFVAVGAPRRRECWQDQERAHASSLISLRQAPPHYPR